MNLTKKIWHDENSEPPKNYLWAKRGKLFKYVNGQWKEVSKKSSNDSGVDLSDFINVVESLSNLGMRQEIMPFDVAIDEAGEEGLSEIEKVYGDKGDYVVLFTPSDQTEEGDIAIAYLTEEELNEFLELATWHFDNLLYESGYIDYFPLNIDDYADGIPVSTQLPVGKYSKNHEYSLDDMPSGSYFVVPQFLNNYDVGNILFSAINEYGYNVSILLHVGQELIPDAWVAIKIYNENETYYFPAKIKAFSGPM